MKVLAILTLLLTFVSANFDRNSEQNAQPLIVAGKGWGEVQIGAKREAVEAVLGKGVGREGAPADPTLGRTYFREYPEKGIQVAYTHKGDKVEAILFYNKQRGYEDVAAAEVRTEKGIDWSASPDEVKKAYGKPKKTYKGKGWRRIVFEGIDFRWENGVMVRIGVPGDSLL